MTSSSLPQTEGIGAAIGSILSAARIPGAAMAMVSGSVTVFAEGFGVRDVASRQPMTRDTLYPIASTTKAMNATLLAMLVEEGILDWDAPVRRYLPRFVLSDGWVSEAVTIRDLVTMRTGFGAHDFLWLENPISYAEVAARLAHLPMSAGYRERFQYNNLTPTVAAHIAEIVTGQSWESLIRKRLFEPLGMTRTGFVRPSDDNVTQCYHENSQRELVLTDCFNADSCGPAGGTIYSTVFEMTRWLDFNINGGMAADGSLLRSAALQECHTAQVLMGSDPAAPSINASYGLGWFVDTYNGRRRISHTGHLHDIHSSVMIFPDENIGLVSFINFASARLATLLNEHAFDLTMGLTSPQSLSGALEIYERKIAAVKKRNDAVIRVPDTGPSHLMAEYVGHYFHAGYGGVDILQEGEGLVFKRNNLVLPLMHWHYDAWVAADNDLFEIHKPQPFDRTNRIVFETGSDGQINAFLISLEAGIPPARFAKAS
jgi:CubicO group peptidase (beta-lactamase class C family)